MLKKKIACFTCGLLTIFVLLFLTTNTNLIYEVSTAVWFVPYCLKSEVERGWNNTANETICFCQSSSCTRHLVTRSVTNSLYYTSDLTRNGASKGPKFVYPMSCETKFKVKSFYRNFNINHEDCRNRKLWVLVMTKYFTVCTMSFTA